jgi:large subunit ribosomal protein L13
MLGRIWDAGRSGFAPPRESKPSFVPHLDVGDFVVVINAEKVTVTGKKLLQKTYYHHSQYPGGIKAVTLEKLLDEAPERVLEKAVRGMLPKTKLGDALFTKLKVCRSIPTPPSSRLL